MGVVGSDGDVVHRRLSRSGAVIRVDRLSGGYRRIRARGKRGGRAGLLLVLVAVALLAAGTVAAAGLVGQPSDPPTGTFPASSGEIGYAISVTPNLDGGGV